MFLSHPSELIPDNLNRTPRPMGLIAVRSFTRYSMSVPGLPPAHEIILFIYDQWTALRMARALVDKPPTVYVTTLPSIRSKSTPGGSTSGLVWQVASFTKALSDSIGNSLLIPRLIGPSIDAHFYNVVTSAYWLVGSEKHESCKKNISIR